MNKEKAGELLGKFWEKMPDSDYVNRGIYLIDLFIEYIYDEGFEIAPSEFHGVDRPKK